MFLVASVADGREYYVSARGNDASPGTRSQPWKTIARVNRWPVGPGDGVFFHGGQTFAGSLVLAYAPHAAGSASITISSYGTGRATIAAGKSTAISILNSAAVVRRLILRGAGPAANRATRLEILNQACDDSKLDGVTFEDVEASGFRWAGIYVGGSPRPGPGACGDSQAGFRHVRLVRGATRGNAYAGIHISGRWQAAPRGYANEDVTIVDSTAHDNPGDAQNLESHTGDGILLEDTDGAVIERCRAWRNGGPVGIWAHNATGIVIQYCESSGNRTGGAADGGGFDFDGGASHSVMQYNRSHDNDGPGYMIWNYQNANRPVEDNVIRCNLSEGDARRHAYTSNSRPALIAVRGSGNRAIEIAENLLIPLGAGKLIETEGAPDAVGYRENLLIGKPGTFLVCDGGRVYRSPEAWRAATGRELAHAGTTAGRAFLARTMANLRLPAAACRAPDHPADGSDRP